MALPAYDSFLQKSVYETNTKHRFFQHYLIPGHITALLFFKEFRVNQFKKLWRRAGKVFSVQ